MKKLITIMAAAASALFAFGDLPSGTSVEAYTGELQTKMDDAGQSASNRKWYLDGDENAELLVTNYESGVTLPPRPAQFDGQSNDNFLKIDTTGRLYRSIEVNSQNVTNFTAVPIGDGIYLDTLVQFTAADDQFKADAITEGDKIAISYVERDADSVDDGETPYTNFVVRAAYVDAANSTIVATNYFLTFPGQSANEVQFDKTAWHRLTVRAISNVGNTYAPVGFVVYVDGTNLVYDTSVAAGDSTYVGSLNPVAQTYFYNSETHALLPSLLRYGETGYNTLAAAAFNGNGCVDDISFTATKPGILPSEGTAVTIAWDANVATYTVAAGETTLIDGEVVSGVGSTNLLLDTSVETLTVTATYATGYEAGTWTVTGSGASISGSTFTVAPGAQLNIVSIYPYFQVGDAFYQEFDGEDGALAAAIAGSGVIKLNKDYPYAIALTEGTVTIDLAGKTITGDDTAAIINAGADLIITNSTVEIGRIVNPADALAILIGGGTTSVYGGWIDGQIDFDTEETYTDLLFLYGGNYVDIASATTIEAFYLKDYAKDDVSYVGDPAYYFQVGGSTPEPPAPTQINVPTAASNLVYDGTEQTGVAAGTGYTLGGTYAATNAGEYEATATPDTGYAWSDGTTHTTNISWSIAADTSATVDVVLTDYEEEYTAQLAFPTASATIGGDAVVGTAVWSPDTITEPAAGATNTYTATFTVTSGNYAGSTGTAEFKVWKAASGGEDWPADPTEVSGQTAAAAFGISGDLANADAGVLATWAKANSVDYSDRTTAILTDAFLLNCANTQEAVDAAKANFKVTAITVVGDTVTITPADAADYGNGKIVIEGASAITSPMSWHTKTTGDHFFRATLVVKPVAAP